ncbi:MAG TPA: DUF2269 family protein [Candidatus Dormibacteraeota bacterium]
MNWVLFWLLLHILAAIIAFGPIFVFPLVGTLAAKNPRHIALAVEINHAIESRLVLPVGSTMLISGAGLIWSANINFFTTKYLIVAVVLYLFALGVGSAVLLPNTQKMVTLVEGEGPPDLARLMPLIKSNQIFGGILTVAFLVIVFLMIIQPGGVTLR